MVTGGLQALTANLLAPPDGNTIFRLVPQSAEVHENPGFTHAMTALAEFGHAPCSIQSSAPLREIGLRAGGTSAACLSDLFLAMSNVMASALRRGLISAIALECSLSASSPAE